MSRRHDLTARVLPLKSHEAADARVGGTVAERLALLAELSQRAWGLTQSPLPTYDRRTMPVAITTLAEQK